MTTKKLTKEQRKHVHGYASANWANPNLFNMSFDNFADLLCHLTEMALNDPAKEQALEVLYPGIIPPKGCDLSKITDLPDGSFDSVNLPFIMRIRNSGKYMNRGIYLSPSDHDFELINESPESTVLLATPKS